MKKIIVPAMVLGLGFAAPAFAQLSAAGPGGVSEGPQLQPRTEAPDPAPAALPGAGVAPGLGTAPKVAKVITGDPTTALFEAINRNDYNAAQDAISRGADMTAVNPLGETPLDLSVALNQNTITFMILSARNEDGDNAAPVAVATQPSGHARKTHAVPVNLVTPARVTPVRVTPVGVTHPSYSGTAGVPDPNAGFMGFGQGK